MLVQNRTNCGTSKGMKTELTAKDLRWLEEVRADPACSINVVVNGYVDEVTDWIGALLKIAKERDEARAEADSYRQLVDKNIYKMF